MSRDHAITPDGKDVVFSGTCEVTGEKFDVRVPEYQVMLWRAGAYAQDAFPQLSENQREFLISWTTPAEWDEIFSEKEKS